MNQFQNNSKDIFEYQGDQDDEDSFEGESDPLFKLNLIPVEEQNNEQKLSNRMSKHEYTEESEREPNSALSSRLQGSE